MAIIEQQSALRNGPLPQGFHPCWRTNDLDSAGRSIANSLSSASTISVSVKYAACRVRPELLWSMGLSFVSANSHADTAKVPKTCLVRHTDYSSTGSESILLASARGELFRMYSRPNLAGKYFHRVPCPAVGYSQYRRRQAAPWFRVQSTKN